MTKWNSVKKSQNLRSYQSWIPLLIGVLILATLLLLASCVRTQVKYVELEREPIDCDAHIKTPLDMANCIAEFRQKW